MLFKRVLIAKLIIQIGFMVSLAISEDLELSYVSENWHKTQVFIFYHVEHSNKHFVDCVGTILSPRFILTTATCIGSYVGPLPEFQHAVVRKVKLVTPDQTNNIDSYGIEKFTIHPDLKQRGKFPDLAILKLTKDIANSEDEYVMNQKVEEFYPLKNPGECTKV